MYKEERLPQNAKEGILFLLIISLISVNTIARFAMKKLHQRQQMQVNNEN